jgi:tRNA nucleotidyltransferase/poly(A) polymerase
MVKQKQIQNFSTFIENSKIYDLLSTLEKEGFEAYLAGGAVRDMLLGKNPHDFDVATNAMPKDIKRIFPKHLNRGERFGTISVVLSNQVKNLKESSSDYSETLEVFEVTTYRSEDVYTNSRHPDLIKFSDSLFEDSKRRDFTINGMYADKEGRLQDPQNGIVDLESQLIRTIGDPEKRFSEDALRVLRALRFSSQLGFKVQEVTLKSALEHWSSLSKVSAERVFEEFKKMIAGSHFVNVLPLFLEHKLFDQFVECKSNQLKSINAELNTSVPSVQNRNHETYLYLVIRITAYKNSSCKFENFLMDLALSYTDSYEVYLKEWLNVFPFKKIEKNRIEESIHLFNVLTSKEALFSAGKIIVLGLKAWPLYELKLFLSEDFFKNINFDLKRRDSVIKVLNSMDQVPNPKIKGQDLMNKGIKAGPDLRKKLDLAYELQIEYPELDSDQLIAKVL